MATVYVDGSSGNDGNGGSQANPVATIQRGLDLAQPGDTVEVANGTYDENVTSVRAGSAGNPIAVRGVSHAAVFRGGGNARSWEINHAYNQIERMTLDGLHDPSNPNTSISYRDKVVYVVPLTVDGSQYLAGIRLYDLDVKNTLGEALRLRFVVDAEVSYCRTVDTGLDHYKFAVPGDNGEGIYFGTSPSQLTGTTVDESTGTIHHIEGIRNSETVNTKEGTDCVIQFISTSQSPYVNGAGINVQGKATVEYCHCFDNDGAGIRNGESTAPLGATAGVSTASSIRHNTVENNDGYGLKLIDIPAEACGNSGSGNLAGFQNQGSDATVACGTGPSTGQRGYTYGASDTLVYTVTAASDVKPTPSASPTPPRDAADRRRLLAASSIDYGVEVVVVDPAVGIVDDITDAVSAVTVTHQSFNAVHRTVELTTTARLAWGYHRVAVTALVAGGGLYDRVPLGVFALTSPERVSGEQPSSATVRGADLLYLLDHRLTRLYVAPADQPVLFLVRELLASRGLPRDRIDNTRGATLLGSSISFPIDDAATGLHVINELLATVGYRGLYMDGDGIPRSEPYLTPDRQPLKWTYDTADRSTIVAPGSELVDNYTDVANHWRFWHADVERDSPTGPGDGEYIVNNYDDGPASQNARGGLVIPHLEGLTAVSQADLETRGDQIVAETKYGNQTVTMTTVANPYHGHMDVVAMFDSDLGLGRRMQHVSWSIDVVEGTMTHELRSVAGAV